MFLSSGGHAYPAGGIDVVPFIEDFASLFERPTGLGEDWPPTQVTYLGIYLDILGCKTIVVERHYLDRDYVDDVSVFYARSLRNYPNHCQRLHFFSEAFDDKHLHELIATASRGDLAAAEQRLQAGYLGFSVIRPLPGCPIGRTVLATFGTRAQDGSARAFDAIRRYDVNLAVFNLSIDGLVFQQQDQGVSACATTALWSALHKVAFLEGLALPTPAVITQSASRYVLHGGRPLPSDGLTSHQMCEAIRATGLSPLMIRPVDPDVDKAEIATYLDSGFPVVLALQSIEGGDGHAVCAVGQKVGAIPPRTDPAILFRPTSNAVKAYYVHDDRLGPYALAEIIGYTIPNPRQGAPPVTMTALMIKWPSKEDWELSFLKAAIVAVPVKLRLTATRMWKMGMHLAQWAGQQVVPHLGGQIALSCKFSTGAALRRRLLGAGLTDAGLLRIATSVPLSRYVGLIQIGSPEAPLFDIVLDATETSPNPSVLACVTHPSCKEGAPALQLLASELGADLVL